MGVVTRYTTSPKAVILLTVSGTLWDDRTPMKTGDFYEYKSENHHPPISPAAKS